VTAGGKAPRRPRWGGLVLFLGAFVSLCLKLVAVSTASCLVLLGIGWVVWPRSSSRGERRS